MFSAESLFSGWRLPEIATGLEFNLYMLQDDHLYHDSLNNKVLLSNNTQNKHDLINLLSHRYPGNITRWIQRATRPSDSWQRCIQLVIFPGICAIIYMYYDKHWNTE